MTSLNNKEIDENVRIIAGSYLRDAKVRPQDEPVIKAGVELIINVLQNLNDIAHYAVAEDFRRTHD